MTKLLTLILLATTSMGIFAKDTDEKLFWKWFAKNEAKIYSFESDQERVLDSISERLGRYKKELVFEISQVTNGKREFIISADGLSELFSAVEALSQAAPDLERWVVYPF